ncbi:MAG: hypothetical protein BMS9Abin10_0820 [Gammaproteobacteria bacterium]|nr:MAG: hypothetical protein BMS9Abin10_0820 [Gammaproteobacteria bacterium]
MTESFKESYEASLRATLIEVLRVLITEGFELPIYWVAVSGNGSIVAGDCDSACDPDDWVMTPRVEHYAGPAKLQLPINVVCIDVRGGAVRVAVTEAGELEYQYEPSPWLKP